MTSPNWSLLSGNGPAQNFGYGVQLGQNLVDRREARTQQNALLELRRQQEQRMQQQQESQAQRQQRDDRRADLPLMERLLTGVTPENYGQRLQLAQQYGVDTSQLPQTFEPAWIEQQLATVKLLNTPQGQEALSAAGKIAADMGLRPGTPEFNAKVTELYQAEQEKTIAYQPGGGVVGYNPATGGTRQIVQPGPSVTAPVRYNPNEWEEVEPQGQGGAGASRVGGNFLDGF